MNLHSPIAVEPAVLSVIRDTMCRLSLRTERRWKPKAWELDKRCSWFGIGLLPKGTVGPGMQPLLLGGCPVGPFDAAYDRSGSAPWCRPEPHAKPIRLAANQ